MSCNRGCSCSGTSAVEEEQCDEGKHVSVEEVKCTGCVLVDRLLRIVVGEFQHVKGKPYAVLVNLGGLDVTSDWRIHVLVDYNREKMSNCSCLYG